MNQPNRSVLDNKATDNSQETFRNDTSAESCL